MGPFRSSRVTRLKRWTPCCSLNEVLYQSCFDVGFFGLTVCIQCLNDCGPEMQINTNNAWIWTKILRNDGFQIAVVQDKTNRRVPLECKSNCRCATVWAYFITFSLWTCFILKFRRSCAFSPSRYGLRKISIAPDRTNLICRCSTSS